MNIHTKTTSSCSSGLSLAYGNFNNGLGFQANLALTGDLAPSGAPTPAPPRPWLWRRLRSCCLGHLTSCPSERLLHSLLASEPVGQGAMQGRVGKRRPAWGSAPVLSPPWEMESTVCGTASFPHPQLKVNCFFSKIKSQLALTNQPTNKNKQTKMIHMFDLFLQGFPTD